MAKKKKKKGKLQQGTQEWRPAADNKKKSPIRVRVAAGDANDKYSEYPSEGLTPRRLARIFRQANEGDIRSQMELFEEMEEKDTHLFAQLQTRKLAVTGLDYEIQPFSESEEDEEIAAFVADTLSGIEDFDSKLIDMLDAIGKGISLMEIEWDVNEEGRNVIDNLEYIHSKKLCWDYRTDEMLIMTREHPEGIPLPENKFVVHRYKARSGHESRCGLLRVIAWMYLFKNYDIKDWISFCEVFGMPLRLGKYDLSASEDDKKQLEEALISLGTDAAGIIPSSTIIEFIESNKTTSTTAYEGLARYCDEQISKAVLGQTLTSDSGGGSYAQSKTHNDVRHDLTVADAKSLAVTIRRDIIKPLVEYNFGPDAEVPILVFDTREAEDLKEVAEVYKILACDMGLEIPIAHIYKKFGIPAPDDGEEILRPNMVTRTHQLGEEKQTELKGLKNMLTEDAQEIVDGMAQQMMQYSDGIFCGMFDKLAEFVEQQGSLEELKEKLNDKKIVKKLFEQMHSDKLESLLDEAVCLSEMAGRTVMQ